MIVTIPFLIEAVMNGEIEVINLLIERGIDALKVIEILNPTLTTKKSKSTLRGIGNGFLVRGYL